MAIECSCPQCASGYKLDDRFAGKKVKCKKCGTAIVVGGGFDEVEEVTESAPTTRSGSIAGRSTAGRSHATATRVTPPPVPPGIAPPPPPSVHYQSPAPMMAPAARAPGRPIYGIGTPFISDSAAGMLSVTLVIATVILMFVAGFKGYEKRKVLHSRPQDSYIFDKLPGITAIEIACAVGGFFVLVVPAVLVARVIGGTVDRNAPSIDLIRVAGVGAVPFVVMGTAAALGQQGWGIQAAMGIALLMFPVMAILTFVATRELMQLSIGSAVLTFILIAIFGWLAMMGTGITKNLLVAYYVGEPPEQARPWRNESPVMASPKTGSGDALSGMLGGATVQPNTPGQKPTQGTPTGQPPASTGTDPYVGSLQGMMPRLDDRIAQTRDFSREQMAQYWQVQFEHFNKLEPKADSPLYQEYAAKIKTIKALIEAAPSDQPPADLFTPPAEPFELTNAATDIERLAPPVKLGPVAIQPLKTAKLDLTRAGQKATSYSWTLTTAPSARVTLTLVPRRVEKQLRPWVLTNPSILKSAEDKGFYVIDYPLPQQLPVKIEQLTMLRLSPSLPANPERRVYAGAHGGHFIELTLSYDRPDDKATFQQMEAMARSLRVATASDTGDPFAIPAVVVRLDDDFANAAAVLETAGAGAEDAVIEWAKAKGIKPIAEVEALLRKIGTRKSAAFLASFAPTPAQPASGQPAPGQPAPGGEAKPPEKPVILAAVVLEKFDLELDQAKKIEMLEGLARQIPGSNRPELAKLLEGIILAPGNDALLPATGRALAVWYGPNTIEAIKPMLEKGVASPYRQAAITALAGTKSPKLVMPIMMCIQEEPEATVAGLIAMGPIAETDVIKLLREQDPNIRRNGARVLKEIGTAKCVGPLKAAIGSDPVFAEAFDAVVARRRATGK